MIFEQLPNMFLIFILGPKLLNSFGNNGKLGSGSFVLSPKSFGNGSIGREDQGFPPKKSGKLNFGIAGQDFPPKNV